MSEHTDDGAPESAQPPTAVTGARLSVAPPLSAGGLVPPPCTHERCSGRLRLAEGRLLRETVCDTCDAVLHAFPPLTYRTPSKPSQANAKTRRRESVLNRPAKLLIADFRPTRLGVRMALADQQMEICAEAGDVTQAIAEARRVQPDICLVGSDLPGGGMAAVRGIQAVAPGTTIIVLAGMGDASELLMAVRAGAIGYIPGTTTREQLSRACRAALAGEAVVPRSMVRILIGELHTSAAMVAGDVTSRQAQVLELLRSGDSPADIARRLEISPVTVRRHISDLVRKLGLENRGGLASFDLGSATNGARHQPSPVGNNGHATPRRQ